MGTEVAEASWAEYDDELEGNKAGSDAPMEFGRDLFVKSVRILL